MSEQKFDVNNFIFDADGSNFEQLVLKNSVLGLGVPARTTGVSTAHTGGGGGVLGGAVSPTTTFPSDEVPVTIGVESEPPTQALAMRTNASASVYRRRILMR